MTPPAIHQALRRTGYRLGRSKLRVGSPDPEYQAKRKQLTELASLRKRDTSSEATALIVPDPQLRRLDLPEESQKGSSPVFL